MPNGFAITAAAYRRFLSESGAAARIRGLLAELRPDDPILLRRQGAQIRQAILQAELPASLAERIREAYDRLSAPRGEPLDVAVRSSATAEDLPDASFAGQQETYLNVQGLPALLDAVRRCFASLFTDRAISYRHHQGFAQHQGNALTLGGFSTLSPDAARKLPGCKGTLHLPNVTMLSEEAAAALAQCKGEVYLAGLTSLTSVPLATKLGLQGSVRLTSLITLPGDAARALFSDSKSAKGIEYYLGLKEISLETAQAIAARGRVAGGHFHFYEVESIPDDVAEAFAFKGGAIRFHKVTKISDRVAKALTSFSYVHMYALSDLSPAALEIISKTRSFQVHGLRRIDSVPFASTLFSQNNVFLSLNKVESISGEAADAMAKGAKGQSCPRLPALKELKSMALAELLAGQKGPLQLPKLETTTNEVVKALARHQGDLDLSGLASLSAERAKVLANREDATGLNGVTELSDEAAAELAKSQGPISLTKLAKTSEAAAAALRSNKKLVLPKSFQ